MCFLAHVAVWRVTFPTLSTDHIFSALAIHYTRIPAFSSRACRPLNDLPLTCDWLFRSLCQVAIGSLLGDQSLYSHRSHNVYAWNYIDILGGEISFLS